MELRQPQQALDKVAGSAVSAASLLKSLANSHRLRVLCVLAAENREMCVTELNSSIDLSQSALSQHLAKLRAENLVATRRESQTIFYSINEGAALDIIQVLQKYFC